MTTLVFLMTLGFVGATVALVTSIASLMLPWSDRQCGLDRLLRWDGLDRVGPVVRAAARRADLAWSLAAAPGLASGVVMLAVAVAGARSLLGAPADHCAAHDHHAHLCWLHGPSALNGVALLGALWWLVVAIRVASVAFDAAWASRLARALESLGTPSEGDHDGVVRVPTEVPLCHAVGHLRPRVLISDRVRDALADDERAAVIAHERGHLRRADPAAATGLALVSAFAWPSAARLWRARWRAAAEEAADAEAVRDNDAATLAAALVRVARFHLPDAPGLAARPSHVLEAHVARLLTAPDPAETGHLVARLGLLAAVAIAIAVGGADPVHHLVEDVVSAVTHATTGAHDNR